jgi:hypothetical protein
MKRHEPYAQDLLDRAGRADLRARAAAQVGHASAMAVALAAVVRCSVPGRLIGGSGTPAFATMGRC